MASLVLPLPRPFDLGLSIAMLRRGGGDPTTRLDARSFVRASRTPDGPGTIRVVVDGEHAQVDAWGDGARWLLERAPDLLGLDDHPAPLDEDAHPKVRALAAKCAGLRFVKTHRVFELLVPQVLGQLVTSVEGHRAFHLLVRAFREPAPGPVEGLLLPPSPRQVRSVPPEEWTSLGVLRKQGETLQRAAAVAHRLEEAAAMSPADAQARLQAVRGIGPWTAGMMGLWGMGHVDVVPTGDYNIPKAVSYTLLGERDGDDEQMLALLEPYSGQRGRVLRYIKQAGESPPRRGPKRGMRELTAPSWRARRR